MTDKVMKTEIWKKLIQNPRFEVEFGNCMKKYSYNNDIKDLVFDTSNDKLTITYNSKIVDRDLDCQFKMFEKTEFYFDDDNNLIVDTQNSKLESKYGYSFDNTNGGVINTHYSCDVYSEEGIELAYQSYSDKYHLDIIEFNAFKDNLEDVVIGAYNPNLASYATITGIYPRPNIIGRNGRFVRKIRSIDDLGIIELTRCSYTPDSRMLEQREEYYFNTFFTSTSKNNPEMIHIMNGFPFAIRTSDKRMMIDNDFIKLGLSEDNYKDVAKDRFLRELKEEKENINDDQVTLQKYNLMIKRLEKEISAKKKVH